MIPRVSMSLPVLIILAVSPGGFPATSEGLTLSPPLYGTAMLFREKKGRLLDSITRSLSPDGNRVLLILVDLIKHTGEIAVHDLRSGRTKTLVEQERPVQINASGYYAEGCWLDSGNRAVLTRQYARANSIGLFDESYDVCLLNTDTGAISALTERIDGHVSLAGVAKGGILLLRESMRSDRYDLYLVSVDGGTKRLDVPFPLADGNRGDLRISYVCPQIRSRTDELYCFRDKANSKTGESARDLVAADIASSIPALRKAPLPLDIGYLQSFRWDQEGQRLAVLAYDSDDLLIYDGQFRLIQRFPRVGIGDPDSFVGSKLVFAGSPPGMNFVRFNQVGSTALRIPYVLSLDDLASFIQ